MPDSTAHGLPYPRLTEDAQGPQAFQDLAEAVDATYGSSVAAPANLPVAGDFTGQQVWVVSESTVYVWTGALWAPDKSVQLLLPDGGFPTSFSGVTSVQVLFRFTIASKTYARRISATVVSFLGYSQANDIELSLFDDSTAVGRSQQRMDGVNGRTFAVTGTYALAAGDASVLEARVTRIGGTGTMSNSAGVYNAATVIAAPA